MFNMLKGFRRLVLAIVLFCGVGLFLFSSEVKAEIGSPTVEIIKGDEPTYIIKVSPGTRTGADNFNNPASKESVDVSSIELVDSSNNIFKTLNMQSGANTVVYSTSSSDVKNATTEAFTLDSVFSSIASDKHKDMVTADGKIKVKIKVNYSNYSFDPSGDDADPLSTIVASDKYVSGTLHSDYTVGGEWDDLVYTIDKPTVDSIYNTSANSTVAFNANVGGRNYLLSAAGSKAYGLKNESWTIESTAGVNYWGYYTKSGPRIAWSSSNWTEAGAKYPSEAGETLTGNVSGITFQLFPKISSIYVHPENDIAKIHTTGNAGNATFNYTLYPAATSDTNSNDYKILNTPGFVTESGYTVTNTLTVLPEVNPIPSSGFVRFTGSVGCAIGAADTNTTKVSVSNVSMDPNTYGEIKTKLQVTRNGSVPTITCTTPSDTLIALVFNAPQKLTFFTRNATTLQETYYDENNALDIFAAGTEVMVKPYPTADETLLQHSVTLSSAFVPTNASNAMVDIAYSRYEYTPNVNQKLVLKPVTGKTGEEIYTLTVDYNGTPISGKIKIRVTEISPEKTRDQINLKSDANYITFKETNGFTLDLRKLIAANITDTAGNVKPVDPSAVSGIKVSGTSLTDGLWKPTSIGETTCEATVNGKTITGIKLTAYPMPTVKYNTDRTLSVTVPTKVSTGYDDKDTNLKAGKGFKLSLIDANGNALYEYDNSKYQSVISSPSGASTTYTVAKGDVEAMVTNAASNGKFSADTTAVKFRVIPMGFKQSDSGNVTIVTKSDVNATTDSTNVYRVTASGTNFATTYAYGLEGQTVNLTASPLSGYTFKQWEDSNTSNPRPVEVKGSGKRSYTAIAADKSKTATDANGNPKNGSNSGLYDDVPKTAEGNGAIWLIIFMVFAVMGTGYALYIQLRAAAGKND